MGCSPWVHRVGDWATTYLLTNLPTYLRGKIVAINVYFKKQEKSQINNLILHIKGLEKEEESPKLVEQRNNKDYNRNKWNRQKKTKEMINEIKRWFFEKIINIETPFTRFIKKEQEEKTQNQKWERRCNNWYHRNIKRTIRDYYEQLYICP